MGKSNLISEQFDDLDLFYFQDIFENLTSPVLVADSQGKIIFANPKLFDLVKISNEEIGSLMLVDLIKQNKNHQLRITKAIESHRHFNLPYTELICRYDPLGKPVKLDLNCTKTKGKIFFIVEFQPINYQSQAKIKALNNQTEISSINNNLQIGIFRMNMEGEIIYTNAYFLDLFKYSDFDEINMVLMNKFFSRGIQWDFIYKKLDNHGSLKNERVEFKNKFGNSFWGLLTASSLSDNQENLFYDCLITKVSEGVTTQELLAQKNAELEKTNAKLDRFLYSTSHDLRSPLTSVMGIINLMKMEENTDLMNEYIHQILVSSQKLDRVIKDMTSFAINTHQKVVSKHIHFENLINKVLLKFESEEKFKNIDFIININEQLPFYGDPERLENIFFHLIRNAILFTDKNKDNPYVRTEVIVYSTRVLIEIIDNGIGISRKYINNIFEMFYRGTEMSQGHGLGLYLVKETLSKLKGKIQVESELGHGSIFHIDIPNGTKGILKSKKLMLYGE